MMKCQWHESQITSTPAHAMWRFIAQSVGIYSLPVVSCADACVKKFVYMAVILHKRSPGCQQWWTCRLTKCVAASAVPLSHCRGEGSEQISEQLTVFCDLIQLCPGRFIRWGLSLPRCGVMNCLSLRSRWSRTDWWRLGRPCRGIHMVIWSTRNQWQWLMWNRLYLLY